MNQPTHDTASQNYSNRSARTDKRTRNGFDDLGIAPNLIKGVNRLHFQNPTPVQKEAIPVGIQGKDIIAIAQTGSGKTIAYGIPMIQRLSQIKRGTALVLVPTRELAIQVDESLQSICRSIHMRSAVLIGGASMFLQRSALKKNPRIIIATPGRLMDHLDRRTFNLLNTEVLILDEADRMLDMGFLKDIKKILQSIPEKRQTMLFSATMSKDIVAIADKFMNNPTRIEIDRSGTTPAEVSHEMFFIKNQDKSRLLSVQLNQCQGPVLVFTRTKRMASKLTLKVKHMGFSVAEIHSDRTLGQRRSALEGFKKGTYRILIATDIAARGIDVSGIELVVNYDMPANSEDYVHRIGRTGRAGKTGHAVSFANTSQKKEIRDIERFLKTRMAISALPTMPSERLLFKQSGQSDSNTRSFSRDNTSNQKSSKYRPAKRQSFKRSESRKLDFSKSPIRQTDSKQKDFKRKESNLQESVRRVAAPVSAKPVDANQEDIKEERPYWSNFKKKRSNKKRSIGQGTKRKRRAKRK